jgi:aspartate aminotransferase
MPAHTVSDRIHATMRAMAPFVRLFEDSAWSRRDPEHPETCDFVFGNPHEMPLGAFVGALRKHVEPRNERWFGYKTNEVASRAVVAESLRARRGVRFEEEDVFLTNGAFAALSVSMAALVDPGDEVVFLSPPWFFYEAIIVAYGGAPVRVAVDRTTYDLDIDAIAEAIGPRTRAIIVNSPHNPTGRIYDRASLDALGEILREASARHGRTVYLLSDESYSRIVFDGQTFASPTESYASSLLLYTYGKTLLTPGQRIGYVALPPDMPERRALREALFAAQLVTGFAFPNALLQHALSDIDGLSIDLDALGRKRDSMVEELTALGYEVTVPQGTFYLLVRSPLPDDLAFCDALAAHRIYALPGSVYELPGTFRLSLTASEAMIQRSLAGFAAALSGVGTAGSGRD